jgi:hypothetical protein
VFLKDYNKKFAQLKDFIRKNSAAFTSAASQQQQQQQQITNHQKSPPSSSSSQLPTTPPSPPPSEEKHGKKEAPSHFPPQTRQEDMEKVVTALMEKYYLAKTLLTAKDRKIDEYETLIKELRRNLSASANSERYNSPKRSNEHSTKTTSNSNNSSPRVTFTPDKISGATIHHYQQPTSSLNNSCMSTVPEPPSSPPPNEQQQQQQQQQQSQSMSSSNPSQQLRRAVPIPMNRHTRHPSTSTLQSLQPHLTNPPRPYV